MSKKPTVTTLEGGKLRVKARANHPVTEARRARQAFREARQKLKPATFNALTNAQKNDTLRDALVTVMQILREQITEDQEDDNG